MQNASQSRGRTGQPSQTALTAAAARAAHPIVDAEPLIFTDPLAARLLGERAEELIAYHRRRGDHPVLAGARTQVTLRSRYAEERVADALDRGVTQYVILGAGLDSFGYRSPLADRLRVFEVDHSASQRWKRDRLADAGIPVPGTVHLVPVDFETDALTERLADGGFDPSRPAVVSWLGVTLYLTRAAIDATLAEVCRWAPGTEIVLDYPLSPELRDAAGRAYAEAVAGFAAERGEPWRSVFTPGDLAALLARHGFTVVEQAHQRDLGPWDRADALRPAELSVLVHARLARAAR
ncbi:SAM-dependent methyltransferase [Micromonospora sp. NPDC049559]|uniref:class I SAM-dependent methyltransferase n=1 Tax=Micromonospora sp. NPDC049559 TaxID=3155923 RepID=UPI003430E40A